MKHGFTQLSAVCMKPNGTILGVFHEYAKLNDTYSVDPRFIQDTWGHIQDHVGHIKNKCFKASLGPYGVLVNFYRWVINFKPNAYLVTEKPFYNGGLIQSFSMIEDPSYYFFDERRPIVDVSSWKSPPKTSGFCESSSSASLQDMLKFMIHGEGDHFFCKVEESEYKFTTLDQAMRIALKWKFNQQTTHN